MSAVLQIDQEAGDLAHNSVYMNTQHLLEDTGARHDFISPLLGNQMIQKCVRIR